MKGDYYFAAVVILLAGMLLGGLLAEANYAEELAGVIKDFRLQEQRIVDTCELQKDMLKTPWNDPDRLYLTNEELMKDLRFLFLVNIHQKMFL